MPIGGSAHYRSEAVESHRKSRRSTAGGVDLRSASSD
jgi:hypothetical protein